MRISKFIHQSHQEISASLRYRFKKLWNCLLPSLPIPIYLSFGAWWLAVNDYDNDSIFAGNKEDREAQFLLQYLKRGMTVLDIGAHHGFYTLLLSKKVGPNGRVIAFEPSPREYKRLLFHLKLNRCQNVRTEPLALANEEGESVLFVVKGRDTGCNSLRPPAVSEPTHELQVKTMSLDSYLSSANIDHVDFIKIDAEGAELEILRGAKDLLSRPNRPVILFEAADSRALIWGHTVEDILDRLSRWGYRCFTLDVNGKPLPHTSDTYEGNLVATPR